MYMDSRKELTWTMHSILAIIILLVSVLHMLFLHCYYTAIALDVHYISAGTMSENVPYLYRNCGLATKPYLAIAALWVTSLAEQATLFHSIS